MSGRQLFQKFRFVFECFASVLRLVPSPIAKWCWTASNIFPGAVGAGIRFSLARRLGARLGDNVYFGAGSYVDGWRSLTIGSNVSIHRGCYIDARGGVTIGDNVSIAHDCSLISFEHTVIGDHRVPIKYLPLKFSPIVIGDDVWLGCAVRVLSGSIIGRRCVVGAGSVVKGRLLGGGVWAGVPAIFKRTLVDDQIQ